MDVAGSRTDFGRRQAETIGRLCAKIGPHLIEAVAVPRGLDSEVRNVVLHDRHDVLERHTAEGGLVLLVGVSPADPDFEDLLKEAGSAAASAVACRGGQGWSRSAIEIAESEGVALLSVPAGVPWGQLFELLQAALATANGTSDSAEGDWSDFGDLFGVAEALAAIAGGAVGIEDMHSRVVAFSGAEGSDELRTNSIMNRQTPKRWLTELYKRGVTQELLSSDDVIHLTFENLEPRRVTAIRVGKSVLGSIWLAGDDENLSPRADAALREAAKVAALHMMRQKLSFDVERQMRESYIGALLRGEEVTPTRLQQLGLDAGGRYVVVGIEVTAKSTSSPPTSGPRLIDLITLHLKAYDRPAIGTSLVDQETLSNHDEATANERIYFLTSIGDSDGRAKLARILKGALEHTSRTLGIELRGAIGQEVDTPRRFADARQSVDDCLSLDHRSASIVQFDDVHALALIIDVEHMVATWRGGPSTAFNRLVLHDADSGTEYVATLIALMDAFGNASTVAAKMQIHANTVRYRIRRITEICGVDLNDGTSRLALELELRAARPPRGGQVSS
jgi:sugar diacid utilization regulator